MVRKIKLPLTVQQKNTLKYIIDSINRNGYPPTIPEIQKELNYNNPGYVFKILYYLEKKGYIIRLKREHRGIRLTELSEVISGSEQLPLFKK